MGLTFKINRPTGQYRSFDHITIDIKVDKEKVGYIGWKKYMDEGKKNGMRVHLYVHAPSERCSKSTVNIQFTQSANTIDQYNFKKNLSSLFHCSLSC